MLRKDNAFQRSLTKDSLSSGTHPAKHTDGLLRFLGEYEIMRSNVPIP
jgi:hypothetical protein